MEDRIRELMGLPYKDLFSYWQHYWGHCLETLIDKDNVSFKIIGPRMLMLDIIDELEGHGLSNSDNIDYFKRQIKALDKNDEIFKSLCHPMVAYLLQRLGDKSNKESSILLCRHILNRLVVERYFSQLVDWLAKTIANNTVNNYENRKRINEITQLIIAEFVAEGFVLDEIKRYATDIPEVAITEGGLVKAAPPEFDTLKESDYPSQEDYYSAVSDLIKNRDVYKCLNLLKQHYYADPQDAFFIVRLNGLKGQIDDYISDINIYSPKKRKYITTGPSFSNVESITEERDWVNAAIPIDYISIDQAKEYAKARLEEVLDIMMLTYRTKSPITMATNIYAVVADGREICMSISARGNDPQMASRDEMIRYLDALDLTDVNGDGFKFLSDKHHVLEVGQGVLKRRLKNASHWYAKAVAADKDVDILLYSWFALEGLLKLDNNIKMEMLDNAKETNALKVIQEFVTSIFCKRFFYSHLRDTYRYYLYLTKQNNNYYDITDDVIDKAGLNINTGDKYRDEDFLEAIPDIMACMNDDIARDELAYVERFYKDDSAMKEKARQLGDDLLMIYRLRNMIVHNASFSCVNIGFYARESKYIAQMVIRYVIDHAVGKNTIDEIALEAKLSYHVFMSNFDEELNKLKKKKVV